MKPQILVVSNPPHVDADHEAAATLLGLPLADAKLKVGFGAPEVLVAPYEDDAVVETEALRDAGLEVMVIDGRELAEVPWPAPVSSFYFRDEALIAHVGSEEIELRYDVPALGVFCKPPADFPYGGPEGVSPRLPHQTAELVRAGDGLGIAETIQWLSTFDLYSTLGDEVRRLSIVQDVTDFSGLGDLQRESSSENLDVTIEQCEGRFGRLEIDARLEDVRPRQRFVLGSSGFDMDLRKLFSFGTLLLRQVLESISPGLGDLPQYELSSRLAYVMSRQASRGPYTS